jgi:hypothetical protein
MALNIEELKTHAKEYVEHEADTEVTHVEFVQSYALFGREDVVLSVRTTDPENPEWWVVGGSTPMNLYSKSRIPSADEAFSFHTGIMARLLDREFEISEEPPESIGYDAFISHASEDKEELVRPLAEALTEMGFRVWYDEFELRVGDSLRQSIDRGLTNSSYGIVVLSEAFFAKNWPQYELDGLVALEMGGQSVILPIWHGVDRDEVLSHSPTLADRVALRTDQMTINELASELAACLHGNTGLE